MRRTTPKTRPMSQIMKIEFIAVIEMICLIIITQQNIYGYPNYRKDVYKRTLETQSQKQNRIKRKCIIKLI